MPLVAAAGSAWEEVLDPEQEFPARGFIFWPRATVGEKGGFFYVRAKENSVRKEGGDDYTVVDARPVFEAIDLRSIGTCEQVRSALSSGIQLPPGNASKVLVWCKGNQFVGPVSLAIGPGGLTTIEKKDRARIPCFQFADTEVRQVSHKDSSHFVVAKPILGSPQSFVDWDEDKQVLRRAIDYAVGHSARGSIDLPKQLIEEVTEILSQNGTGADLRLELYRLNRGRVLAAEVKQLDTLSGEVVAALRKHPAVLKELEQVKADERKQARSEAEATLTSEREELRKLKREQAEAQSTLGEVRKSLDEADALVRGQTASIEEKIQKRIAEVLSDAPTLLAEVALLKPFLGERHISESNSTSTVERWKPGEGKVANTKDLRSRIVPALKAYGVPTPVYQPLHAALSAGLLPIVAGARALDTLLAYAHVVAGGRSLVVPITSAVVDVQDLFGRVAERRFVPHPTGLIDVVRAAKNSTGLFLVVLEGINRSATESYLLPLMKVVQRPGTVISLFHPAAVEAGDPYRSAARIEWPQNLILAGTLVEGPTTLPVASDLWSAGALVQTDLEGVSSVASELNTEPSEIEPSGGLLTAQPTYEHTDWIKEAIPQAVGVAARFEGGLRCFTNDAKALQESVAKYVLVPFLASIEDERDRAARIKDLEKLAGVSLEKEILAARRRIS